jgi:peptide chain release factor subunit 1
MLGLSRIYLLKKFMKEIRQETNKYVFGLENTLSCLDLGAVKILIVWENLDINRYVLKNTTTSELVTKHLNKEQEIDQSDFRDSGTNV